MQYNNNDIWKKIYKKLMYDDYIPINHNEK